MALNWNFENVKDLDRVTTNPNAPDEWHPVAHGLVMLSMVCGFNQITEKNYEEVCNRVAAYQLAVGAYLRFKPADGPAIPVYIGPLDIKRFIGMTTNSSTMTNSQWMKRIAQIVMDQVLRQDHPPAFSYFGECETAEELA